MLRPRGRAIRLADYVETGGFVKQAPGGVQVLELTPEEVREPDVQCPELPLDALAHLTLAEERLLPVSNGSLQLSVGGASVSELSSEGLQSRDLRTSLLKGGNMIRLLLLELSNVATLLFVGDARLGQTCLELADLTAVFGVGARERVFEFVDPRHQCLRTRLPCRQVGSPNLQLDALILVSPCQFLKQAKLPRPGPIAPVFK